MLIPNLKSIVTEKNSDKTLTYSVVEVSYKSETNTLWITDVRGYIMDFDMALYDVRLQEAPVL